MNTGEYGHQEIYCLGVVTMFSSQKYFLSLSFSLT